MTADVKANKGSLACLRGYGAIPTHERVCVDGNLVSCTGPAASEEVASLLLGMLVGEPCAAEVGRFRLGFAEKQGD